MPTKFLVFVGEGGFGVLRGGAGVPISFLWARAFFVVKTHFFTLHDENPFPNLKATATTTSINRSHVKEFAGRYASELSP